MRGGGKRWGDAKEGGGRIGGGVFYGAFTKQPEEGIGTVRVVL